MSDQAKKPPVTFFVIGAAKCGTTSLYRALQNHPEVYAPEMKEPRFFDLNWSKGWQWYADQYKGAEGFKAAGDFSPSYSNSSGHNSVADRIARNYPSARLIYMVRNPISCAISNWRMHAEMTKSKPSFIESATGDWSNVVLDRALFFRQLNEYRRNFPDEQILCIPLEEMQKDPAVWLEKVQRHLGVNPIELTFPKANKSSRKPDRPAAPPVSMEDRRRFCSLIEDDATTLLEHIGSPRSLWDLSENSKNWAG